MLIKNGKYYAVPVNSDDTAFELEMQTRDDRESVIGQRISLNISEPVNEIEAAKEAVKDGIAEIKKGGLKAAFGFAKKMTEEYLKDDKQKLEEKSKSEEIDPMDPINAYAFNDTDNVTYEPIYKLDNKDHNTEDYQFRTKTAYGVLQEVVPGLLREISFSYPSLEYAQKHFENEILNGHSSANWRREDSRLHKMRVHYLSTNKETAEAAAKAADMTKIEQSWLAIDHSSTRAGEKTRFAEPRFVLNSKSSDLTLHHIEAWFLPRLTKEGRQIQYNWDAFRVRITQGDKLIKRFTCWSAEVGFEVIKSQRTSMALGDGGYIGELTAGQYELRVSLYNEEVFCYPFEMIKTESSDVQSSAAHYFNTRTPRDDYANVVVDTNSWDLNIYYPRVRLLERFGSAESVDIITRIKMNGEDWQGYEWNEFEKGAMLYDITVRGKADWAQDRIKLSVPIGDHSTFHERKLAAIGDMSLHIEANGEEIDRLDITISENGELVVQDIAIDQPLADIDFPEEHGGRLIPFK